MKYFQLLLAFSFSISAGTSFAETVWVAGVTPPKDTDWQENVSGYGTSNNKSSVPTALSGQGWYDSNKKTPIIPGNSDALHCWAATAANMLEWWQVQNADVLNQLGVTPTYSGLVDDTNGATIPHYSTSIFKDAFAPSFKNQSGYPTDAIEWYFSGTISNPTHTYNKTTSPLASGGFYVELENSIKENVNPDFSFGSLLGSFTCQANQDFDTSTYLKTAIKSGKAVALAISGHAVTCWGAEFDDGTELLTNLYITDSDDNLECGLRKVSMKTGTDNVDMLIKLDYESDQPQYAGYYFPLKAIYTLDTGNSTLLALANIPEPSMFGLFAGFGALLFVASKRRKSRISAK